jgi:hypothetical protein
MLIYYKPADCLSDKFINLEILMKALTDVLIYAHINISVQFRYLRAARLVNLKGSVCLILAKAWETLTKLVGFVSFTDYR